MHLSTWNIRRHVDVKAAKETSVPLWLNWCHLDFCFNKQSCNKQLNLPELSSSNSIRVMLWLFADTSSASKRIAIYIATSKRLWCFQLSNVGSRAPCNIGCFWIQVSWYSCWNSDFVALWRPNCCFFWVPCGGESNRLGKGGILANLIPKRYSGDSITYNRRKNTPANVANAW